MNWIAFMTVIAIFFIIWGLVDALAWTNWTYRESHRLQYVRWVTFLFAGMLLLATAIGLANA